MSGLILVNDSLKKVRHDPINKIYSHIETQIYKNNIDKNKLEHNENESKKLFSSISLSGLSFKPPESFESHQEPLS